jgi:peroxiredoxin
MNKFSTLLAGVLLAAALVTPAAAQDGAPAAGMPALGTRFPNISLPDVNGAAVSLADFQGKAVLLSFWSCYTDTCFTSVRVLDDLLKEYSSRGLVAPTICSEVPPALAQNGYSGLLKQCGTGQVVLIDKDMALTKSLGIVEFPTTYLVDRNRVVWKVITGVRPLLGDDFRQLVKSLVME